MLRICGVGITHQINGKLTEQLKNKLFQLSITFLKNGNSSN